DAGNDLGQGWERALAQGVQQLDVHMRDDLIAHLGDCVVVWNSPKQGGLGFTGAVAALPMRDAEQLGENLTEMWDKLTEVAPNKAKALAEDQGIRMRVGYLGNFEHGGSKVWWIDHIDRDLPFGISWTSTDRHALFAMQPQAMRSAIDDSKLPNFDTALVRKPQVARRGKANAMLYVDLQALVRQSYGVLLMLFQTESHTWHNEGFGFDLADVPRLEAIAPHLGPELTVLEEHGGGFLVTRRGSLPVFDALLVTSSVAC